jgi:ADP-ribosylglycohydrolase
MEDSWIDAAKKAVEAPDYAERVYAGMLGKVIGVYLGRPFEGWHYDRIQRELGDIEYYVHDRLGVPLLVTDDDIAGTATFIRAAGDSRRGYDTTAQDVADCWLNYLVEGRSVLWWGGMGNSTEHTAYLRLKDGVPAPESGSIALNGKTVAEQIGAQIFIDGWAMIAPGAPELAAELARRAGSVSHDGEAIYGAQLLAAMESAAFETSDIDRLLDIGVALIPGDSIIVTMIADVRRWHREEPDWRVARAQLDERYGYDIYGGNCHMVPNHGLIVLALLYGGGDFSRSLSIVNTGGWDTDCNSGNLGCLLGIMHGLEGIDGGPDWRGPVADRMYVPTADAGGGITDVVIETMRIVNMARSAVGLSALSPKGGARFHFSFPGSVQGFVVQGAGEVGNAPLPDAAGRGLLVTGQGSVEVTTATFIPPEAREMPGYSLDAAPTIYSGQELTIEYLHESGDSSDTISVAPLVRFYGNDDELDVMFGPDQQAVDGRNVLTWTVPALEGRPIVEVGLIARSREGGPIRVLLDSVGWSGTPTETFGRPESGDRMWRRAWVDNLDEQGRGWPESFRLIADSRERRLMMTGTNEWRDYAVEATLTPHMADATGVAARVQGLERYYLLRWDHTGGVQLIKRAHGDHVLAAAGVPWTLEAPATLRLEVEDADLRGYIDGVLVLTARDEGGYESGGIAVACEFGRVGCDAVTVRPVGVAAVAAQTPSEVPSVAVTEIDVVQQ